MTDHHLPSYRDDRGEWIVTDLPLTAHEATEIFLLVALSDHRNGLGAVYEMLGRDQRVVTELQKRRSAKDAQRREEHGRR